MVLHWNVAGARTLRGHWLFLSGPSQVYIRTPSGEVQTVLVQDSPPATAATASTTTCSSPASRAAHLSGTSKKHSAAILRKERPLPKIAPAGSIISLNAAQLAAAAQAMQTININGVQVQGVPVTITNTGGEGRPLGRGVGSMPVRPTHGPDVCLVPSISEACSLVLMAALWDSLRHMLALPTAKDLEYDGEHKMHSGKLSS